MHSIPFQNDHSLAERFRNAIRADDFPCVGAKSALARGNMDFVVARDIRSSWDDLSIHSALTRFVAERGEDTASFRSFVVLFEHGGDLDELGFETSLWARLQSLSDKDAWLGQDLDPAVSDDPEDPHFSLSFGGQAFFVVGLHPGASRPARRFATPALVFNLHDQFERLRNDGRYEKLRSAIISRDVAIAGSENPMLARHGTISEARQYSGRAVESGWRCPFAGRRDFSDAA